MNTDELIKSGINSLREQNEAAFKKNIQEALNLKKAVIAESLTETISRSLLETPKPVCESEAAKVFGNFVDTFVPGKYTFQNGSSINITESEVEDIQSLLESLNPQNQEKMLGEITTDGMAFRQHLQFYNNIKALIS